jgi:hypothetical protein
MKAEGLTDEARVGLIHKNKLKNKEPGRTPGTVGDR